jgi:diguanylate cyclase
MVALGRHLGLMTVAEGIETTEQHELLVDLGCDLGQGYLLGRPLDADGASQLVHRAAVD